MSLRDKHREVGQCAVIEAANACGSTTPNRNLTPCVG